MHMLKYTPAGTNNGSGTLLGQGARSECEHSAGCRPRASVVGREPGSPQRACRMSWRPEAAHTAASCWPSLGGTHGGKNEAYAYVQLDRKLAPTTLAQEAWALANRWVTGTGRVGIPMGRGAEEARGRLFSARHARGVHVMPFRAFATCEVCQVWSPRPCLLVSVRG